MRVLVCAALSVILLSGQIFITPVGAQEPAPKRLSCQYPYDDPHWAPCGNDRQQVNDVTPNPQLEETAANGYDVCLQRLNFVLMSLATVASDLLPSSPTAKESVREWKKAIDDAKAAHCAIPPGALLKPTHALTCSDWVRLGGRADDKGECPSPPN